MSVLFINACIRGEESRTLRLCREYIAKNVTDEVTELELSTLDIRPLTRDSLHARDLAISKGVQAERYPLAVRFAEADEIIIGAPYWDCGFPSLLKVYIENISVAGITLKYDGGVPVRMCRAKRITCITTVGGYLPENSAAERFVRDLAAMFSIPEHRFIAGDRMDVWGCDPERILSEVISRF